MIWSPVIINPPKSSDYMWLSSWLHIQTAICWTGIPSRNPDESWPLRCLLNLRWCPWVTSAPGSWRQLIQHDHGRSWSMWRTVATGCFFTPLRYLAPAKSAAKKSKQSVDQWMINGSSMDHQWINGLMDPWMINGWSVDQLRTCHGEAMNDWSVRLPRKESPKGSGPIREP